ncbi:MAG TPA: hypothetical protein VIY54_12610 [Steroidobacteraceae bacterium]
MGRALLPAHYRLIFAATYVYSPRGRTAASERSRTLCVRLKSGRTRWLHSYVARVLEQTSAVPCLQGFFPGEALLIPVPTSGISGNAGRWTARYLADAMNAAGLGSGVWSGLRRATAVGKSATAWMCARTTVSEHFRSFAVDSLGVLPAEIVLIDDVITKGRTLVAAAMRMQQACPRARIRGFALVRTMGLIADVPSVIDPCRGAICWNGLDAYRTP